MTFNPKNLLLLGLALITIGVLVAYLFRPVPKPEPVGLTLDEQESIQHENAFLALKVESLERELSKVTDRETTQQRAHVKAVTTLKKEIAKLERDTVVKYVRQSYPQVDSLLKAKDSLNVRNEDRIRDCENAFRVAGEINEQVKEGIEKRLANTEQLLADEQAKNIQGMKENRKLRRKLFWTKVTGVLVVGGIVALSL